MGIIDSVLGNKNKDGSPELSTGYDPYGAATQHIDPSVIPLMNAPQTANAQIAQFATDNTEVVERFKEGLRGKRFVTRYNTKTGREEVVEEVFSTPAMNETGVSELTRELEMYLNKTFILTNVPKEDRERIDRRLRIIWSTLAIKLVENAHKYELDKSRRSGIIHEFVFTVESNMMRGYEDGERGKYYGSQRTVQTISQHGAIASQVQQEKKRGIFG